MTRSWRLPTGLAWLGETVVDGLHRILAQGFGYSDAEVTGFLGLIDTDDTTARPPSSRSAPANPTASATTARSRTAGSTTSPSATSTPGSPLPSAPTSRQSPADPHRSTGPAAYSRRALNITEIDPDLPRQRN